MGQGISRRSVVLGAAATAAGATSASGDEAPPPSAIETPTGPATTASSRPDAELVALGAELERLKRRCWRQRGSVRRLSARLEDMSRARGIGALCPDGRRNPAYDQLREDLGCTDAWRRWSEALSASLVVVAQIERTPAAGLAGLEVKYRALVWRMTYDDDLMDEEHARALQQFGNQLRDLVGQSGW